MAGHDSADEIKILLENLVNKDNLETFYQYLKAVYVKNIEKSDNGIKITKGDGSSKNVEIETTDTKNTTGSTNSSEKMFLVGATEQAEESVTYTNTSAYIDENGQVFSGGNKTATDDEIEDILIQIDEALESMPRMVAPEDISNPNLLINPDFKINQRGQAEYTGLTASSIYTIDRWYIYGSASKLVVNSDSVKLSGTIRQKFEIPLYENTTYTLSVMIDGQIFSRTFYTNSTGEYVTITNGIKGLLTTNELQLSTTGDVTSIDITWVKLELGSIATRFIPTDPATELVKCQRYYFATKDTGDQINDDYIVGTSADIRWIPLGYLLPTKMRTVPTVNISSIFEWGKVGNNEVDTIQPTCQCSNWCIRNIESSTDSFVADTQYYIRFTADAEIY